MKEVFVFSSIATWPKQIKAGSKSDHPSTFYDYFATVSDIIGEAHHMKLTALVIILH